MPPRCPLSSQRNVIYGCHFSNVITDAAFNERSNAQTSQISSFKAKLLAEVGQRQ